MPDKNTIRTYAVFDKEGVCTTVVKLGDRTATANIKGLEHIKDKDIAEKIKPILYSKLENVIQETDDKEVDKRFQQGIGLRKSKKEK